MVDKNTLHQSRFTSFNSRSTAPKFHTNMASIEQEITAAISEDELAGDDDDMQTSNYGTRSDPELDSDSDGDLTATM